MSKEIDDAAGDSRVDGRVQDGYRFVVKFRDGTREYYRDSRDLASVTARFNEALWRSRVSEAASVVVPQADLDGLKLFFSGARAVEGQWEEEGKPPADVIGEVVGKGWVWAADVRGLAYSKQDDGDAREEAYQIAGALLDSQNVAQERALENIQEVQRKLLEGAGVGDLPEDPNASIMG